MIVPDRDVYTSVLDPGHSRGYRSLKLLALGRRDGTDRTKQSTNPSGAIPGGLFLCLTPAIVGCNLLQFHLEPENLELDPFR